MKALVVVLGVAILAAAFGGYVENIVELFHNSYSTGETIVKAVGIVVPVIGAVAGWVS